MYHDSENEAVAFDAQLAHETRCALACELATYPTAVQTVQSDECGASENDDADSSSE